MRTHISRMTMLKLFIRLLCDFQVIEIEVEMNLKVLFLPL